MKINSQSNYWDLFFFTAIEDARPANHTLLSSFLNYLEKSADKDLEELRYGFQGKKFTVYADQVITAHFYGPGLSRFVSTLDKVHFLATTALKVMNGTMKKAFCWAINWSYINQRNQAVLKLLKRAEDQEQEEARLAKEFEQSFDSRPHVKSVPTIASQALEDQGSLALLPPEIKYYLFSFVEKDKDLYALARTSKFNLNIVSDFYNSTRCYESYPSLILQILGKDRFDQLPISLLSSDWRLLFEKREEMANYLEQNKMNIEEAWATILSFNTPDAYTNIINKVSNISYQYAIHKLQRPEGNSFIFYAYDNTRHHRKTVPFIITQAAGKWMLLATTTMNSAMWLFLNGIRFDPENPKLKDYFKRLINGEPCGCFPDELNGQITINYRQENAIDALDEGPRVDKDGRPVIQLCSNGNLT